MRWQHQPGDELGRFVVNASLWLLVACPGCGHLVAQGMGVLFGQGLGRQALTGTVREHSAAVTPEVAILESTTRDLYEFRTQAGSRSAYLGDGECPGVDKHVLLVIE
jgi:hypothetical protein